MPNFDALHRSGTEKKTEPTIEQKQASLKIALDNTIGDLPIDLQNQDQFLLGNSRFLYGFTESPDHENDGFLKAAKIDEQGNHTQLKRESGVMSVVHTLGVPSVDQIKPYEENNGYGVVHFERLTAEDGELLATPEIIATADPKFGSWGAKALQHASGVRIPKELNTDIFKKNDSRNASPETFWSEFNSSARKTVGLSEEKQVLLNADQIQSIEAEIETLRPMLERVIQEATDPEEYFFVHNDAAPNNTFFNTKDEQATLLDFEHAGVTHNPILAKLTDFGNFYARTWANPEMQSVFISTLISKETGDDLDNAYVLAKAVILFGSMNLAKYGMDPNHGEHKMSKMLLGSLLQQLDKLETLYIENKI